MLKLRKEIPGDMEIYLDNSATTQCYPKVARRMCELMTEAYGNPSSLHHKGIEAEQALREAKRLLRDTDKMIYEIAQEAGFTESKYFISKFTDLTGVTPAEYRRMGNA